MGKIEEQKANAVYADHFTRIPNILFESYKYLTKEEVLLYIRLRYIYWDTKPRYLSLRELADITGYSTGALSKMLPRLNTVGLVHAEIKKKRGKEGKEKGNPAYHISINDIWEENRKFFAEGAFDPSEALLVHQMNATCSPNEQDIAKPVHQMNKPVHKTNDLVQEMNNPVSFGEQDQAQNDPYKTIDKTSNKTSLQEERMGDFTTVQSPHAFSENEKHSHANPIDAWHCEAYCNAQGKTCADYQAYIDSGAREETPTEPRTPAIQIGEHDATSTTDRQYPHAASRSMDRPATEETPVAIASTPGEATTPLVAKTRQSKNDGATTVTASEPRPSGKGKKVTQAPPELSPEVTRILDDWDSLHKKPVPRIEANITAAQLLVAAQTNREEMKGCRDWLPTTDRPGKPWYRKIGVHLPDIAAKLEQYRSLQDMSEPVPVVDKGPGSVMQAQWEAAVQALPRVNDGERRSDFDAWVGNGPEERKRWRQKSAEMKAAGYSPDL